LFCFSVSGPISFVDFFSGVMTTTTNRRKKIVKTQLAAWYHEKKCGKKSSLFLTLRIKKMRFFSKQSDNKYKKKSKQEKFLQ